MLNIPASMKPTLDAWATNHTLGKGQHFSLGGSPAKYEEMMDQVILADNDLTKDAAPEKNLVVFKDDGETHRYKGDSKKGDLEAVTADGRVVALHFDEKSVDFLQLTKNERGVEALQEHFDRQSGDSWMQVGGAVQVVSLDDPNALGNIFGKM